MKYQSKKDETIFAKLGEFDDKYKTYQLEYLTGEKAGKTITVTEPTLKRWWKKVEDDSIEETVAETVQTEPEVLNVKVVDEETGKTREVEIDPVAFVPGVDDSGKTYDFNNQEKKHIPMPKAVKDIYRLGEDPYPTVDEVVDMLVSWGASVKKYAEWIKLLDGTRVLFRRNKVVPVKSVIEIRLKDEVVVPGYETQHKPVKSALIKDTPYVINVKTISDLEKVVKSLLATE